MEGRNERLHFEHIWELEVLTEQPGGSVNYEVEMLVQRVGQELG